MIEPLYGERYNRGINNAFIQEYKLRTVRIKAKKGGRSFLHRDEFYEREVEDGLQGRTPGEWVKVVEGKEDPKGQTPFLVGVVNPLVQQGPCIRTLQSFPNDKAFKSFDPKQYLKYSIERALKKRSYFKYFDKGCRILYGAVDGLPGVIADEYLNCVLLQINTAGMDLYRDYIRENLQELRNKKVIFLDQEDYRKMEGLPLYEREEIPNIEVEESGIQYRISKEVMQKIGHYYDHRINRLKLRNWMENYHGQLKKGVDLFCYSGSWGLNALAASEDLEKVHFVDQGNLGDTLSENLKINGFEHRGEFSRRDVFDWLKEKVQEKEKFDLVISDPPAFSKSLKNKTKALGGYLKLHKAIAKICKPGTLLAIGSCTHGVTLEELDQTVNQAFWDTGMEIHLLDLGIQGPDHLMSSLSDRENYIKFLCYLVC